MVLKSYLIAPLNSGLVNNVEPFLIPEDAFQFLTNAYIWRGRLRKRFGYFYIGNTELNSRLRIDIGETDNSGDITVLSVPGIIFAVGQMFSIGTEIFSVVVTGTPGDLLRTGSAALATYDTTSGELKIEGAAALTKVFFYPADPVMGLRLRETPAINFESTVGFDTQFAYRRTGGAWDRLGTALWTGENFNFYWTINYRGANPYETFFYVVNGIPADNIKYLPVGSTTWVNFRPQLNTGPPVNRFLETAKIIIGFKDRLVVLNTIEKESGSNRFYQNRARFSQNGDPTNPVNSWIDDTIGKGGFVDAATEEAIITCEFIKDRLIVYFERSTWELVYTGDSSLPFRWQQINNELGAESRFSIIGFDKTTVGVGNVGIHACNGVNVERIDQQIPDEVFKIHNGTDGIERVYGIRDFYRELVYWTFPDATSSPTFPTKILVWNYQNNSFSFTEDSFTCFGYFQKDSGLSWAQLGARFGNWAGWNEPWSGAPSQSQFPFIVAGNQQGFTFIIEVDRASNEQSLYITDMNPTTNELLIINHNLKRDSYVLVEDAQGITSLNGTVFQVESIVDENTITLDVVFTGIYTGGGKLTRISQFDITSKQWNPGTPVGQQFRMPYIDFLLDRTTDGEVSVDYLVNSTSGSTIQSQTEGTKVLLGNNTLFTRPEDDATYQPQQVRIWHRYFLQTEAMMLQIKIFMTDDQMRNLSISRSDFQMDAILLYVDPGARIVG